MQDEAERYCLAKESGRREENSTLSRPPPQKNKPKMVQTKKKPFSTFEPG